MATYPFGISRRQVIRGAAAAAMSTLGAPSVQAQKAQQTLRFAAQADLKSLDPIWTTAYITRNHGYLAYDTLFGTDENSEVRPQMVDRTTVSPDGTRGRSRPLIRRRSRSSSPSALAPCSKRWESRRAMCLS